MAVDTKSKTKTISAQTLLGIRATNTIRLLDKIEKGLPITAFERLQNRTGIPTDVLLKTIGIKPRTYVRRKRASTFSAVESDRLVSLSRLFALTIDLFEGEEDAALRWITAPNKALGNATPLELASTETGTREVENLIGRLEHGVFT